MREEDETSRAVRHDEDGVAGDDYGPGATAEVTLPVTDEAITARESDDDTPIDPEVRRDGGPTRTRGVMTTTGGRAGPASVRRRPRRTGGKVAPTTSGDATTGGMSTPAGGSTSDAAGQASQIGNFTDR